MKQRTTFREWAALIAFGTAGMLAAFLLLGAIAVLIGLVVAAFTEIPWYAAAVITYLVLRLMIQTLDALSGLRGVRCPACKRKILTSNPIKCEECGGAARLAGKKYAGTRR
jgi:hypothetical protein